MREVREVTHVSHCFCLREVVRDCLREVREVTMQVIENTIFAEVKLRQRVPLYLQYIRGAASWLGAPLKVNGGAA